MYSCTMPVLYPKGEGGSPGEAESVLFFPPHKMILRVYTVMVWCGLVEVLGGLGCFNEPHDGYAYS